MQVRWTPDAIHDLGRFYVYRAQHDPDLAQRAVHRIRERVREQAAFPHWAPRGRLPRTREPAVQDVHAVVVYRVRGDILEVLRVWDDRRPRT